MITVDSVRERNTGDVAGNRSNGRNRSDVRNNMRSNVKKRITSKRRRKSGTGLRKSE